MASTSPATGEPPRDVDDGPGRAFTELTSVMFSRLARYLLAEAARNRVGARITFRSPPKDPTRSRAVARNDDGSFTISILIRGRNAHAVAADMIDGIMHVAGLGTSEPVFSALWETASTLLDPLVDGEPMGGS